MSGVSPGLVLTVVGLVVLAASLSTIEAALASCHGRVDGPFGAAQRLGVNPHTLRARMRKLGIDWKRFRPPPP